MDLIFCCLKSNKRFFLNFKVIHNLQNPTRQTSTYLPEAYGCVFLGRRGRRADRDNGLWVTVVIHVVVLVVIVLIVVIHPVGYFVGFHLSETWVISSGLISQIMTMTRNM